MNTNRAKGLVFLFAGLLTAGACINPPAHAELPSPAKQPVVYSGCVTIDGGEVSYAARLAPTLEFPGWVDSNSPAFWSQEELVVFNSAFQPTRVVGSSLEALGEPTEVVFLDRQRDGGLWIEAVWPDPESGTLYGWYHLEPDDLPCLTAPFIGAAISFDHGASWLDMGPVLDTEEPIDCSYDNGYFVGGHGDFSVLLDQENSYFYFLYSNYSGGPAEQGVALARSAFDDRGLPGSVFKYFNGAWEEPGLGGKADPAFQSTTGWAGPMVEAFWGPSVHWNDYLGLYVVLLNHTRGLEWQQEGVYIAFSQDLAEWTEPQKLLDVDQWYPQVAGLEPGGTDRSGGRAVRVYVGGKSEVILEFDRGAGGL